MPTSYIVGSPVGNQKGTALTPAQAKTLLDSVTSQISGWLPMGMVFPNNKTSWML
jgi:hypothetical protein